MITSYERGRRLYRAAKGISEKDMSSEEVLKASPEVKRISREAWIISLEDRIATFQEILTLNHLGDAARLELNRSINTDKALLESFGGIRAVSAADQIKNSEVIEFTEVFGGGVANAPTGLYVMLPSLEDAINLTLEGSILGFEIGGVIHERWSPTGVIRKWGKTPNFCQIKTMNMFGQEGSGIYDDVHSVSSKKFIQHLLDNATISTDREGPLGDILKSQNLTPEECAPQFRAL